MSEVIPLFSTPVYVTTADAPPEKFQQVLDYCKQMKYNQNVGQNWTSDHRDILSDPMFKEINEIVQKEIDHYTKNIMMWDSNEFYITQSWLNVNPKDTEHHIHYHYNSIMSGTFYLSAGDNDSVVFHRKHELSMLTMKRSAFNIWNSDFWKVRVKTNTIVLFPSTLYHSVDKNESDYDRVSIAFNVFARGEFGTEDGLTYLKL